MKKTEKKIRIKYPADLRLLDTNVIQDFCELAYKTSKDKRMMRDHFGDDAVCYWLAYEL